MVATLLLFSVFTVLGESNHSIIETGVAPEEITIYTSDNGHFNVTVKEQENHTEDNQEKTADNLVRTIVIDSEDSHLVIDTIPTDDCNCSDVTIESRSDDRSFKLKIDNGVIKELKINGKEIDDASKYFKQDENGKIKWIDTSDHSKVIWTDNGDLLLKEKKQNLEIEEDDKLRKYDFAEIEKNEVLKAPFKIGNSHNNQSKDLFDAISEEMKKNDQYHKDLLDKIQKEEEDISKNHLKELLESLTEKYSFGHELFEFPESPQEPKIPMWDFTVPSSPTIVLKNKQSFINQKPSSRIFRALQSDGLIQPDEENALELTDKHLKINGEKQPTNIWKKYKKIYESQLGHELMEGSKIKLKERTKANSRFFIG